MAIPLLAAMAASAAIQAGYSAYQSDQQKRQADAIKANRPKYSINPEVYENQAMFKNAASTNALPGQPILENKLNQDESNTINSAKNSLGSGAGLSAAIIGANRNKTNADNTLSLQGAQMRYGAMGQLAGANNAVSEAKDREFGYNQDEPYRENMARKNALLSASQSNTNQAVNSVTNGITNVAGGASYGMGGYGEGYNTSFGDTGYGHPNMSMLGTPGYQPNQVQYPQMRTNWSTLNMPGKRAAY